MTLIQHNFEAGTNGATVSNDADSGFDLVLIGSGSSFTYDTARAKQGLKSLGIGASASGAAVFGEISGLNSSKIAVESNYWFSAIPTADSWFGSILSTASSSIMKVVIGSSGRIKLQTIGSSNVWVSTNSIPVSEWLRFSVYYEVNGSTGTLRFDYYIGNSTTPAETGYSAVNSIDLGTNNIDRLRFGKANTASAAPEFWIDALQYDTDATSQIGAWTNQTANGSYVWNGTDWVKHTAHTWDGSQWNPYDAVL